MTGHSTYHLEVFQTTGALHSAAAQFIIGVANKAVAEKGRFSIALSGGQTPAELYSLLAEPPFREQMPWQNTFVFWGDERYVPAGDERNNAHVAIALLLRKVAIPLSNIRVVPVNLPSAEAAAVYEQEIRDFFGQEPYTFDLVLLGLGENGHTASLFPGTDVIDEQAEGVRAVYIQEEKMCRITMTAPLINRAHHILFLVTGENKAKILQKVLMASPQPNTYPAQLIKPANGELYWFIDSTAATKINN